MVLGLVVQVSSGGKTVMENGEHCCVKVAVHIRPLIGDERMQGCKECVTVVPGKPQVIVLGFLIRFLFLRLVSFSK